MNEKITDTANTVSAVAWAAVAIGVAVYWVYNAKSIIRKSKIK